MHDTEEEERALLVCMPHTNKAHKELAEVSVKKPRQSDDRQHKNMV